MIRRDLVTQECVLSFLLLFLAKNGALCDFVRTPKTARATAPKERRARATAILSLLSGAVSASRAVVQADPALANHILAAAGDAVDRLTV